MKLKTFNLIVIFAGGIAGGATATRAADPVPSTVIALTFGEYSNLMTYSESLRGSQAFYTIQPFVNVLQAAKARTEAPASPPSGAPPAASPAQPVPEPAKEPSGSKE